MFASDYDLVSLAQKELKRAVGCLLGYGWRKDPFALEVLESLGLVAKNNDDARKALLNLAGEFEAITDYTDGSETHYAREKYYAAIAAHFPERAPACYAHLIRNEEWQYAEALADAFAVSNHAGSRAGRALLETYIVPSEIHALVETDAALRPQLRKHWQLSGKNRRAGEASFEQRELSTGERTISTSDDSESGAAEVPGPELSEFPPGHLQRYLNELRNGRSFDEERKLVTEWLRYWEAAGRVDEALDDLETAISEARNDLAFDSALDVAFEISLETHGRSRAWPWLIRAHVARSGWNEWFTSDEEFQARMRVVAHHYPEKWQEFISKTAKPKFAIGLESSWIAIGLSRLVNFLVEVDKMDLARAYALEMARVFKEELTEQPIKVPEWSR